MLRVAMLALLSLACVASGQLRTDLKECDDCSRTCDSKEVCTADGGSCECYPVVDDSSCEGSCTSSQKCVDTLIRCFTTPCYTFGCV
ncbi:hypothetical protein PR048_024512 [Dryococelus australis]|uniref:Uncharacterized protein n=1 Tax=Dryococelus australis TaxID=614101 RepID=A0ABQ9GNR4_9NEOP|nr:hypothetical protein PR048_024512 [Dryococelus australis]